MLKVTYELIVYGSDGPLLIRESSRRAHPGAWTASSLTAITVCVGTGTACTRGIRRRTPPAAGPPSATTNISLSRARPLAEEGAEGFVLAKGSLS